MKMKADRLRKISRSNPWVSDHSYELRFQLDSYLQEAQQVTLSNLQCYVQKIQQQNQDAIHDKIRCYLTETFMEMVTKRVQSYRQYLHSFQNLLAHYQSMDPTFFLDADFEEIVAKPLEKRAAYTRHPDLTKEPVQKNPADNPLEIA